MRYNDCLLHIEPNGIAFAAVAVGPDPTGRLLFTILPHRPIMVTSGSPEDDWEVPLEPEIEQEFEIVTPSDDGAPRKLVALDNADLKTYDLARSATREAAETPFALPALAVTPGSSDHPGEGDSLEARDDGCSIWISNRAFLAHIVLQPRD